MKKTAVFLLVFIICFSTVCLGAMFPDTNGHWAEKYIDTLAMEGVVSGTQNGEFEPDGLVTREQFLKMLMIVTADDAGLRLSFENPPTFNTIIEKSPFSDVAADRWSYYYIREAYGRIIFGEEYAGCFEPVKDITREEAAVFMARALDLDGGSCSFTDNESIKNTWMVGAAAGAGLISGFEDGSFHPGSGLTRAQAAVMLKRAEAVNASIAKKNMATEVLTKESDLNKDGVSDIIKVISNEDGYVLSVNDLDIIGGECVPENNKYYIVDIDKNDNYSEVAVAESDYNSGALAIYRYTGDTLYLMGYIESVGAINLRSDDTPIGDEWGAVSINKDGTVTANVGVQFVHTMLLRKQYTINAKNRLEAAAKEFYTIGNFSDFTVQNMLTSTFSDAEHPNLEIMPGYVGKIVKTDLKNWIYIETGSGNSGWIYIQDDQLISGEPLSYYLDGLWYAG